MDRKPYPSDVSDDEWAFVAPYLASMAGDASKGEDELREAFNGLRWLVHAGAPWPMLPHDLPPWSTVHQQTQRWLEAGVFATIVHDLQSLVRPDAGRTRQLSVAVLDGRNSQSMPENGQHARNNGMRRTRGSKLHLSGATCDAPSVLQVMPVAKMNRVLGGVMTEETQQVTDDSTASAVREQGCTSKRLTAVAVAHGLPLEAVVVPEATNGYVLLPPRWVVERNATWTARFRSLVRDYERLPKLLGALHS